VGFIVTNGDPTGETENTLVGADFQYRNTDFLGRYNLQSDVYYARSFSDVLGEDDSFGTVIFFPNEPVGGELRFKEVGANYDPALGFANRPGIRDYNAAVTHITRFRDSYLRDLQFGTAHNVVTTLDNEVESRFHRLWVRSNTVNIDTSSFDIYHYYENVPAPFTLPGGIVVPAGKYDWTNVRPYIDTTQGRDYVLTVGVECCSFYNGSFVEADVTFIWRPTPLLELVPRWVATYIDLPTGAVDIHVLSLNTTYNFSPDMQFLMQAQFDNISRNFGLSARFRWEYSPGNDLFIGFGQSAVIPGTDFVAQSTQFSVRLGRTIRF
jgi:hypothetical protein